MLTQEQRKALQDALIPAGITATGCCYPDEIIANSYFEKILDTSDQWIVERTGIHERRRVAKGQTLTDLAAAASREALTSRGMNPDDIDCIIVGTTTPDTWFPSAACILQEKLGATKAWCFDLPAACSSYLYALSVAVQYINTGRHERILVVGGDVMSSILNYEDRASCILFGDGAAATLVEAIPRDGTGIFDMLLKSDGRGGSFLRMPAGGSQFPASPETIAKKMHAVHQEGKSVFKTAVPEMANVSLELLARNNLSVADLALFVPHQANLRILEACAKRMELDFAKVMINIDKYANTTGATIPSCLHQARTAGRIKKGDLVQLSTFGAGFTWGSMLLRWTY